MFNVFEQPWTLTGLSIMVLLGVLTFRSVLPEKRRFWQWLIPIFFFVSAFALDLFVKTDLEKINTVIDTGMKAVDRLDYKAIESVISDNYSDRIHFTKESLMAHCRRRLPNLQINKNKKQALQVIISVDTATAHLFTLTTFDKNSFISRNYKPFVMAQFEIRLQKQSDGSWLINRVEIRQVDKQPVSWSDI